MSQPCSYVRDGPTGPLPVPICGKPARIFTYVGRQIFPICSLHFNPYHSRTLTTEDEYLAQQVIDS